MAIRPKGLKLTKYNISQDFDLKELTGVEVSSRLAEEIATEFLDHIEQRTLDGKDIQGNDLKGPYSEEYSESQDFKDADKSRNDVNMTLTGDMLASMVYERSGNRIKLKFDDEKNTLKAANHNGGVTVPTRQFFGLTESEAKSIINTKFKDEIERLKDEPNDERISLGDLFEQRQTNARDLFGELFSSINTDNVGISGGSIIQGILNES